MDVPTVVGHGGRATPSAPERLSPLEVLRVPRIHFVSPTVL
jgi:hypothetical protein